MKNDKKGLEKKELEKKELEKKELEKKELDKKWKKLEQGEMKEETHQLEMKEGYAQDESYDESKD